jgi:hypothetical protein
MLANGEGKITTNSSLLNVDDRPRSMMPFWNNVEPEKDRCLGLSI